MDLESLSHFAQVWERVTGASCPLPMSGAPLEERLMDRLYTMWQGYRCMGLGAVGGTRHTLLQLAEEARNCFRALQTERFLQGGEVYHPSKTCNFASCTMSNLRKMWEDACEMTEMLHSVAVDAGNPYAETCKIAESVMHRHRDRLRCMISRCMK